jgi:hypothetical protein
MILSPFCSLVNVPCFLCRLRARAAAHQMECLYATGLLERALISEKRGRGHAPGWLATRYRPFRVGNTQKNTPSVNGL